MEKAVRSEGLHIRERVAAIDVLAKSLLDVESFADGLSARLVALEGREPIPGPPGPQGEPGPAGKDGTPGLRYCGVYVRNKTYDQGDLVTAGGSAWYCRTTTAAAPGNSGDWSLMVKRGRDARERQAVP